LNPTEEQNGIDQIQQSKRPGTNAKHSGMSGIKLNMDKDIPFPT